MIIVITILTGSSNIHFSPRPSIHPPITAGHHNFITPSNDSTTQCIRTTSQSLLSIVAPKTIHSSYLSILNVSLQLLPSSPNISHLQQLSDIQSTDSIFSQCHWTAHLTNKYRRGPHISHQQCLVQKSNMYTSITGTCTSNSDKHYLSFPVED